MTLTMVSDVSAPSLSRRHLDDMRPRLEPRFDDVALVVSELVANSVRHAPEGSEIEVKVIADHARILIEVSDEGAGFDGARIDGEGLGLRIVAKLADSWGVKRDLRFTVWVELSRTRGSLP